MAQVGIDRYNKKFAHMGNLINIYCDVSATNRVHGLLLITTNFVFIFFMYVIDETLIKKLKKK